MTDKPINEDKVSVGMEAQGAGMNQKSLTPEKLEELKALALAASNEPWTAVVSGPRIAVGQVLVQVSEGGDWPVIAQHVHAFRPSVALALISQAEAREGENTRLRDLVKRLAEDLRSEVSARYGCDIDYPGIKRKFDADMEIVQEAEALTREGDVSC